MSLTDTFQKFTRKLTGLLQGRKKLLRAAIERDDWATAGKILQADKSAMGWEYNTVCGVEKPLHLAARSGAMQILAMMANPSFGNFPVDERTSNNLTPAMIAAANGHELAARLFIARGADLGATGGHAGGLLCCAVSGGSIPLVDLLLSKGLTLNETDPAKGSPLMTAAYRPDLVKMMKFLLDKGADPNIHGGIETLRQCLHAPNPDGFRLLLERGAKVDLADREGSAQLLFWAVAANQPDIVATLLDRGIDPLLSYNDKTILETAQERCPKTLPVIEAHLQRKETEARNQLIDMEVRALHAGLPEQVSVKTLRLRKNPPP